MTHSFLIVFDLLCLFLTLIYVKHSKVVVWAKWQTRAHFKSPPHDRTSDGQTPFVRLKCTWTSALDESLLDLGQDWKFF